MIYLLGLLIRWIGHALIPALILLALGAPVLLGVWWFLLRPRQLSVWRWWLVLGLAVLGFAGWRTWEAWQDFSHPELQMFRSFVAEPIPKEVQGLAPATSAPVMFHDGAYISFHASQELVQRIVNHSLPGSKTLAVVAQMKRLNGRDPSNRLVIAAPDGQSYLKVDLDWAAKDSPDSLWARTEVENFLKNRRGSAYVLLLSGDWGKFASVLTYDPAESKVTILQNLERTQKGRTRTN